ncbi:hypothetical protein NM962_02725 [Mycobacterium sp. SVM_VP21]|nr:hypothetical protein NM962_02725 [Mycobacterium sp. SVM_VP21]
MRGPVNRCVAGTETADGNALPKTLAVGRDPAVDATRMAFAGVLPPQAGGVLRPDRSSAGQD